MPNSLDSELRERLFQRPTILATPRSSSSEAVAKAATTDGPAGSSLPNYGPSIFNHPDSDDPIAQTLCLRAASIALKTFLQEATIGERPLYEYGLFSSIYGRRNFAYTYAKSLLYTVLPA